jgi:hypothetical protein
MRVTTTYNGADEVAEKKKRSFVFCVPISRYNLLILDSWSSLFHNYRICLWAFLAHGLPPGQAGFMQKPAQAHTHGPLIGNGMAVAQANHFRCSDIVGRSCPEMEQGKGQESAS